MTVLKELDKLIQDLSNTTSSNSKREIIASCVKKDTDLYALISLTLDPFKRFNVTSEAVEKFPEVDAVLYKDIVALLNDLTNRVISGHEAKGACKVFAETCGYKDTFYRILDKDLKCRTGASIFNKVFPGMIPEWDVALCTNYKDRGPKIDFSKQTWYCARKLDGCLEASTVIEFDDGSKRTIQEVVENCIEGNIKSFDTQSGTVVYRPIINHFKNGVDVSETKPTKWYRITTKDGKVLTVTGNHLVWLPDLNAWRRVDELTETDRLLS